jgi:hypothetical protein
MVNIELTDLVGELLIVGMVCPIALFDFQGKIMDASLPGIW